MHHFRNSWLPYDRVTSSRSVVWCGYDAKFVPLPDEIPVPKTTPQEGHAWDHFRVLGRCSLSEAALPADAADQIICRHHDWIFAQQIRRSGVQARHRIEIDEDGLSIAVQEVFDRSQLHPGDACDP